jgi:hypothetical protein
MPLPIALARRRLHRITFILAGVYNLAWGIASVLFPQWLFVWAGMPLQRYPEIFVCLAMVVGIYGLLYFEVARKPEDGAAIALVGLLGKVLGPIGLLVLIAQGKWPARTVVLILTNDLIWWLPFGLYLHDLWRFHRFDHSAARLAHRASVRPTDAA